MKVGDIIYSQEYNMVGKLINKVNNEAELDLIDTVKGDTIYCDIRKCNIATEEQVLEFFNTAN